MIRAILLLKKICDVSNLIKKQAISEAENKITTDHDHDRFIIAQKLNKLTSENVNAKLAKANLASKNDNANFVNKTDFDDKLKKLNKKFLQIKQNMYLLKINFKKLEIFDSSLFIRLNYLNNVGSQNHLGFQLLYYT